MIMSYKNSQEQGRFQETKWISVNDRLPECIEKYGISKIVLCLDARGRAGFGIYQNGERQLYYEGWFTGGEVGENCVEITHWMPIPDPPKNDINKFRRWEEIE